MAEGPTAVVGALTPVTMATVSATVEAAALSSGGVKVALVAAATVAAAPAFPAVAAR